MSESSTYNVNIVVSAKDRTSTGVGTAKKSVRGLEQVAKAAALGFAALRTAQAAVRFVEFGAGVDRAARSLDSLAQSAGTSGKEIVSSIQEASAFTIDKMVAMEAANKAMLLQVAQTPGEFSELTDVAVKLGRAMGLTAAQSLDKFTVAAGRQSTKLADDLGLLVGVEDATQKYALQLGKTADELSDTERRQAFLNEMLVQGKAKVALLGDEMDTTTATSIEQFKAGISDLKSNLALLASDIVGGSGVLVGLTEWARESATLTGIWREGDVTLHDYLAGVGAYINTLDQADAVTAILTSQQERQNEAVLAGINPWAEYNAQLERGHETFQKQPMVIEDNVEAFGQYQMALDLTKQAEDEAAWAAVVLREKLDEQRLAAEGSTLAQLGLAAQLKDASSAQIAQAAISQLKTALDEGTITFDQYQAAVSETQLAFGLANEGSVLLSSGIATLVSDLVEGKVPADKFAESLAGVKTTADKAQSAVENLSTSIQTIPDKTVRITVKTVTEESHQEMGVSPVQVGPGYGGPSGDIPGMQHGGQFVVGEAGPEIVTVTPTNSMTFNQTINTAANTTGLGEFEASMAMARALN